MRNRFFSFVNRASYMLSFATVAAIATISTSGQLHISYHASIGNDDIYVADDNGAGRQQLASALPDTAVKQPANFFPSHKPKH